MKRLIPRLIVFVSIFAIVLAAIAVAHTENLVSFLVKPDDPKAKKVQEIRMELLKSPAYTAPEDFSGFSPEDVARLELAQKEAHEHEKKYAADMAKGFNHKAYGHSIKMLSGGKRVIIAMYENIDTTLPIEDSQGYYITYLNPKYASEFFITTDFERALKAYKEGKEIVIDGDGSILGRTVLRITNKIGAVEYVKGGGQ